MIGDLTRKGGCVTSNNWLVFGGYPKHGADTEVCKKNTTVVILALPKIYFKTGSSAASAEICECFSSELTLHDRNIFYEKVGRVKS